METIKIRKISRSSLINLILLTILILVIVFGYFYFLKKSPVEYATTIAVPDDINFKYLYTIYGKGKFVLDKPEGVAYGNDRIWVADTRNRRVVVFDRNGEPLFDFGRAQSDKIKLAGPVGVLVDNKRVFVVDIKLRNIVEYTLDGKLVGYFGEKTIPMPAALKKYNDKYVALDMATPGLIFLDSKGKVVDRIAGNGTKLGKLEYPQDIAVLGNRVYVTDSNNNRVVYAEGTKGELNNAKVKEGSEFSFPFSIAATKDNIYVGSALSRAVKVYGTEDEFTVKTAINAADKDGIGMGTPVSIAVDETGRVYVVDLTHSRVLVYSK